HLDVTLRLSDRLMSTIFERLDQLISLNVSTPRLYSLTIAHWNSSIIKRLPLYPTSNSICRIDLQNSHYLKCDHYFNSEQCATFLRSPLVNKFIVMLEENIKNMTHDENIKFNNDLNLNFKSHRSVQHQAGSEILRRGGIVADATVAAHNVTEACSYGIGGDCFVLYYNNQTKRISFLNGSNRNPKSFTLDIFR
ncbi:unnamed protein product, partial [Rotaria magnacalcarata]